MTLIQKAIETNKAAENSLRFTIDGVQFTRFPLHEVTLCVHESWHNRYTDVAEATKVAIQTKEFLATSGMSWEEIWKKFRNDYYTSDNIHYYIWTAYSSELNRADEVFSKAPTNNNGLWSIPDAYDNYIAIYPRDGSHLIVAEYFPSKEDVKYLKEARFVRHDITGHPDPKAHYFLGNTEWNPETMEGILSV